MPNSTDTISLFLIVSGESHRGRCPQNPENPLHPKQKMRDAANSVELSIDRGGVKVSTGGCITNNPDEGYEENPLG